MKNIEVERPVADSTGSKDKQALVLFLLAVGIFGLQLLPRHSQPPPPVYAVEHVQGGGQWQVISVPDNHPRLRPEGIASARLNSQQSDVWYYFSDTNRCQLPARLALFFRCPLPINQSSLDDLLMLPGIGHRRAALLLAERQNRGQLRGAADLLAVPGIGPATLQRFLPLVSFE